MRLQGVQIHVQQRDGVVRIQSDDDVVTNLLARLQNRLGVLEQSVLKLDLVLAREVGDSVMAEISTEKECIGILSSGQGVVSDAAIHHILTIAAQDDVIAAQSGKQVVPCRTPYYVVVVIGDGDQLTPDLARPELARMDIEVERHRCSDGGRTENASEVVD